MSECYCIGLLKSPRKGAGPSLVKQFSIILVELSTYIRNKITFVMLSPRLAENVKNIESKTESLIESLNPR